MSSSLTATTLEQYPERILCVLGMHRSGTSCLTGSLQEAGLSLGDCHTWNPHNLKGNRENQQIVDVNDRVLAANGGAWDEPPEQVSWSEEHLAALRNLLASYSEYPQFGFKDPRTLLVLGGWKSVFPHMQFVGIFRHPRAVAGSLQNRSGMPTEVGMELWYQYNKCLLRQYREQAFPVLCFDDDQAVFQQKLRDVLLTLGFDARDWQGEFYDQVLKSSGVDGSQPLPWKIRRLYRKLLRLAE